MKIICEICGEKKETPDCHCSGCCGCHAGNPCKLTTCDTCWRDDFEVVKVKVRKGNYKATGAAMSPKAKSILAEIKKAYRLLDCKSCGRKFSPNELNEAALIFYQLDKCSGCL